jgi:tetratricopeptide (TPR) repeat protein
MPSDTPQAATQPGNSAQRPSWSARLLGRFGIVLPENWSATRADIIGKVIVGVATAIILATTYAVGNLGSNIVVFAWQTAKDHVVGLPKADPKAPMSILVARLAGDDGTQTRHVVISLQHVLGRSEAGQSVQVLDAGRQLHRGDSGDEARDHGVAQAEGRRWLKKSGATILIWGEVAAKDKVLRLFFTPNTGELDRTPQESYTLSERLELVKDFQDDLGLVIAAHVTALAAPAYETGRFIGDLLDGLYPRLVAIRRQLMQGPVGGTKPACYVTAALAVVAESIGEQRGLNTRLSEAIELFRSLASEKACLDEPFFALTARIHLGNGLAKLGERESGTARLDEAVAVFREALKELTRERVPLDWAMMQSNLANTLGALGEREIGTARLDEAVAAYREALKELTRERVPLQWATTQNNLGNALRSLGERESGTARLDEAVAALRETLKERTRERVPLQWATTQNDLGAALQTLGERESGTARLDEAVAAFREALKEQTRERVPFNWAITQSNLGIALQTLGERESGTAQLEESVAAFHEALEVFELAGAEYFVQGTRDNLVRAEALLAERRTKPN